jgi:hypothetical protein
MYSKRSTRKVDVYLCSVVGCACEPLQCASVLAPSSVLHLSCCTLCVLSARAKFASCACRTRSLTHTRARRTHALCLLCTPSFALCRSCETPPIGSECVQRRRMLDDLETQERMRQCVHQQAGGDVQGHGVVQVLDDLVPSVEQECRQAGGPVRVERVRSADRNVAYLPRTEAHSPCCGMCSPAAASFSATLPLKRVHNCYHSYSACTALYTPRPHSVLFADLVTTTGRLPSHLYSSLPIL